MMRFLFFLVFLYGGSVLAQTPPDTVVLKEIFVQASRVQKSALDQPISVSYIDSSTLDFLSAGNLSEALTAYAPVFVRTNGPGGLSTLSQRGYSSSQTQVLWNGFQLNHAMLGLTDLSLIPSSAIQEIAVVSGSGNSSFGEKGGGSVVLNTKNPVNKIGFAQSIGSYNSLVSESFGGVEVGAWKLSLFTTFEKADNDFTYLTREFSNEAGGFIDVEKRRENNESSSKTGILNASWKRDQKEFFSTLWVYDASNNIPGGISSLSPRAFQDDSYFRFLNRYSTTLFGNRLTSKLYVNRQKLDFINPSSDINSLSTSNSLSGDVELRTNPAKNIELITSTQFGYSLVDASDYSGTATRTQLSVQAHPVWQPINSVTLFGGLRIDYYSDFKEAFSANFGANIQLVENRVVLKSQVSRNFVAPTFNDLYWPGLGNPDLNPEENLNLEAGVVFQQVAKRVLHSLELTGYTGTVNDGIRWLPGNDGLTRPENLEEIRLSGFEIKDRFTVLFNDLSIEINSILLHSLATLQKPRFEGDRAEGKQLRYTPEWILKLNSKVTWRSFATMFLWNFTEERYSTADHSSPFDPLPSYSEASWIGYTTIRKGGFQFTPQFSIRNLLDEEYSVIRDYPMPGRNYQIKLSIKYQFK